MARHANYFIIVRPQISITTYKKKYEYLFQKHVITDCPPLSYYCDRGVAKVTSRGNLEWI